MAEGKTVSFGRWLTAAAVLLPVLFFLYVFSDIVLALAVALLLAFVFEPFVNLLEQRGLKRIYATLVVFVAFLFLVYLGLSFFIPKMITQMGSLLAYFQETPLASEIEQLDLKLQEMFPFLRPGTVSTQIENSVLGLFEEVPKQLTGLLSNIFAIGALILIIPFSTFFLVKDKNLIVKSIMKFVPNRYFEMSFWIIERVSHRLGRYVRGWVLDATFVGTAVGVAFWIIGLENAFALGLIAGIGNLVPYLGPVIAGIPAAMVSVAQFGDLRGIPLIILAIIIVYAIDNGFVQPIVYSKNIDMHPMVIALLIIAGGQLYGILGMLLIIPAATVLETSVKEIVFALRNYSIARAD